MAGVYLHIPYCKVKCHYCDFHFSVQTDSKGRMVDSLVQEIEQQKAFFSLDTIVNTIYFGGGTPSIITPEELNLLIKQVYKNFAVSNKVEITVECNPDDLNEVKLRAYRDIGINRLSIGVQSFNDASLKEMNRAHTSEEAIRSIRMAQEIGFDNITIDLIYGVPNQTIADWEKELDQMNQLNIPHLSAYCLTIEPNTVFGHRKQKGDLALPTDREYLSFFNLLRKKTAEANMEHYEISNFAKSSYVSQHNSAYWRGKPYLGIGPSAHSFDGKNRSWNIANNFKYMAAIEKNESCRELEVLKTVDRFNDYLITRLRTKWGIDRAELNQISANYYADITPTLNQLLKDEKLMEEDGIINLTPKGLFISDAILEDLFCLEESD
jgi:oxygen-independent coproporphyrinogen III oxidase